MNEDQSRFLWSIDIELAALLANGREAYDSGDSSDISDALRDLLMYFDAITAFNQCKTNDASSNN
jgi:hypothetical protein